jgi:hypothetical protein
LDIKQTGTIEEYFKEFQELQFQICMHNDGYGDLFFASQFVNGLKEEIKYTVQAQVPEDVERALLLAKIQQRIVERGKAKYQKSYGQSRVTTQQGRTDSKSTTPNTSLWRERQLRDYRKTNGLCFYCGEKFEPGHVEVCQRRVKSQLNTLAMNDLDQNLTEEVLDQLAVEDALTEEFYHLSINAISGTEGADCIKIRSLVKNKVMLTLMDSGSSHSFVSAAFVAKAGLTPVQVTARQVKLANGEMLNSDQVVPQLEWWCQGHTLKVDMRVLDMGAYDAILWYDRLKPHSPMTCHWEDRTIEFKEEGRTIKLQGVKPAVQQLDPLPAEQLWKACKGNDIWAFVILENVSTPTHSEVPDSIQQILQ